MNRFVAKTFDELTTREIYEILKARAAVFVVEQNIVYQDMDDKDYGGLHVYCEENGKVTAYLRAFKTEPGVVRMGRVLTLQHGQGLGGKLLRFGLEEIRKRFSPEVISIDSQCHAIGFYEKAGFKVCSEEFLEEGIMHVKMELKLNQVISVEQMRKSDAYTIEHYVPSKELMYRAAEGVYNSFKEWTDRNIAITVGGGNNGGDGYALAGILMKNGISPSVIKVSDKLSEDGKYYHDIALNLGVEIIPFSEDMNLSSYDIIVDCILGTGFTGDVRGVARDAIEAINKSGATVISVDIPSGMNGDNGEASLAVVSDLTVSIGYIKQGLVSEKAKKYIKSLVNVDIGIVLV